MAADLTLAHFHSREEVLDYVRQEFVATLEDDLRKMEREERQHYSDEDRQDMRNRIADVRAVLGETT